MTDLLSHIYVLIPVLDDAKHYWVGDAEVGKLLKHGEGWLAQHPQRALITRRYLKYQPHLTRAALTQLMESDQSDHSDPDEDDVRHMAQEAQVEKPLSLNQQRVGSVIAALRASGARRVLDLGCAEGQLIRELMKFPQFTEIVGLDVSFRALETAAEKLHLDRQPSTQRERVKLLHGSLMYRDKRIEGFEAAAVVEVIEHLDPPRLMAFERVLFEFAKPAVVIVTTPNIEYNVKFETLPAGRFRHRDHRFEWTRLEFQAWAERIAGRFGYQVRFLPIGETDPAFGAPTQMAIFSLFNSNLTNLTNLSDHGAQDDKAAERSG